MAKPKFNYDSDDFYDEIFTLAMQGANNGEIAYLLEDKFGVSLSPDVFSAMVNGNYSGWTEEENERRSARISRNLMRARQRINSIVRGRYLKSALGGIKTKNVTSRRLQIDGQMTDNEVIQTTEIELPPNMQALSTWLYHHDPEWRKVERRQDEEANDVPTAKNGVDISSWIEHENEIGGVKADDLGV